MIPLVPTEGAGNDTAWTKPGTDGKAKTTDGGTMELLWPWAKAAGTTGCVAYMLIFTW